MSGASWRYISSGSDGHLLFEVAVSFSGDGLENAFCAWDIVSPCPLDGLSDSKREGFKGRLSPVVVILATEDIDV